MAKDVMLLDDKKEIKQSNRLIESRYCLTKYEQRMMIAICSQLVRNADEFETVRVRVADMADFCNIRGKDKYAKVKSTLMRLLGRVIQLKKEKGWYATHWLQSAEYFDDEGIIEYCVDQRLKPELLQLKAAYLSTPAAPLMEFRRDYSARFYFLLKKSLKLKEIVYDLDFIRDRFRLGSTYKKISNLKNGVIEPAIAEINAKSDITVIHEYIKSGRAYTKIKFKVALKVKAEMCEKVTPTISAPPSPPEPPSEPPRGPEKDLEALGQTKLFTTPSATPESETTDTDEEKRKLRLFADNEALFAKMTHYFRFNNEKIENLITTYGAERVKSNLDYALQNKAKKRNMAGWIISCIEQDHAGKAEVIANLEAEAEAKKREELMASLEPLPTPEIDPNDKRSVKERFADFKAKHKGGV